MMMMAEVEDQQRRRGGHHAYHHLYNNNTSSNNTTNISTSNKKLKTRTTTSTATTATVLHPSSFNKSISSKEKNDKFGEKVAALQQLVSPFGKTDTASVLSEATGYIRFLHEQLQVLSAPYIGTTPAMQNNAQDEKYSLRRRGLCLMPITATLSLPQSNGADLWAPTKHTSHNNNNLHGVP